MSEKKGGERRSGGAEERRSGGAEERRSGGAEERRSRGAEERRSRGAEEEERTDNFWIQSSRNPTQNFVHPRKRKAKQQRINNK
ncbi:MAG: hypothetical protein F6K41_37485 [Symploca sp. SIO3E6]|nr:hypothetical protein [Caldora sp. SIO3E6]